MSLTFPSSEELSCSLFLTTDSEVDGDFRAHILHSEPEVSAWKESLRSRWFTVNIPFIPRSQVQVISSPVSPILNLVFRIAAVQTFIHSVLGPISSGHQMHP